LATALISLDSHIAMEDFEEEAGLSAIYVFTDSKKKIMNFAEY